MQSELGSEDDFVAVDVTLRSLKAATAVAVDGADALITAFVEYGTSAQPGACTRACVQSGGGGGRGVVGVGGRSGPGSDPVNRWDLSGLYALHTRSFTLAPLTPSPPPLPVDKARPPRQPALCALPSPPCW